MHFLSAGENIKLVVLINGIKLEILSFAISDKFHIIARVNFEFGWLLDDLLKQRLTIQTYLKAKSEKRGATSVMRQQTESIYCVSWFLTSFEIIAATTRHPIKAATDH